MKKKFLAGIIVVAMAVTVVGCAGAKEPAPAPQPEVKEETNETTQVDEIATDVDETEPEDVEEVCVSRIHPLIKTNNINYTDDNGTYYSIQYDTFEFEESEASAFTNIINSVKTDRDNEYSITLSNAEDMRADAQAFAAANPSDWGGYDLHYLDESSITMRRADTKVFSYLSANTLYYGGPHDTFIFNGYNYDGQTGELIGAKDFFVDSEKVANLISNKLLETYSEEDFFDATTLENDILDRINNDKLVYVINPTDVKVYINSGDLTPYAVGTLIVTLYPEDNIDYYNSAYYEIPDKFITKMGMDTFMVDVNGDGVREQINIQGDYEDEQYAYSNLGVVVDGESAFANVYAYGVDGYLVKQDDKFYVYVTMMSENDYSSILIFDITGGTVNPVGTGENLCVASADYNWDDGDSNGMYTGYVTRYALTDPTAMMFESNTDYLSTIGGVKEYYIEADGTITPMDYCTDYRFIGNHVFTALTDFAAIEVDEDGNEIGDVTVNKGEELIYYRTDNETYGDVKTADGKIIRIIRIINDEFWFGIDGKDVDDVLGGVMFAG